MNIQIIHGRLGKDPEVKAVGDTTVANFSVAVDKVWFDKNKEKRKRTEWFECSAWGKDAENIAKFFHKGDGILIRGETETRTYDDTEGVKQYARSVRVDAWEFGLGKAGESKGAGGGHDTGRSGGQASAGSTDDIPF